MLTTFRRNLEYGTRQKAWLTAVPRRHRAGSSVDKTLLVPNLPSNEDRFSCDSAQGLLAEALKVEIHRQFDAMSEEVSLSKELKETVEPLRATFYVPTAAYAKPHGPVEFIADTGTSFFVLPEENVSERMRKRIHTLAKPLAMATVNRLLTVSKAINVGVPNPTLIAP